MRYEVARFALVVWPNAPMPDESNRIAPCCVTLDSVESAMKRGAVLVGREWDWMDTEMTMNAEQSNPIRHMDNEDQA